MTGTVELPQRWNAIARETRRTWLTAVSAVAASLGIMLLATPGSVSPVAYWVVSSIALATVLIVFVVGENVWDEWVANARAAGVVGR
ncbi:hypothetical protein C6A85_000000104505 [Mycobacterium sp. ITM-2017-0098]|nr:hypothetical protein C6A85_000000104505 [Mycobacterium sp. ITM-2017-0098]